MGCIFSGTPCISTGTKKTNFAKFCCKVGQGQLRVIIYINFVELEYIMHHAKFQDHRRRFLKDFTICAWRPSRSGHVTQTIGTNYCHPSKRKLHIKFGFHWPSSFREEDN